MASDALRTHRVAAAMLIAACTVAQPVAAQKAAGGAIYSCVDDRNRRLTADRPIPECTARQQQLLNRDGSLRAVVPPTLTADERAAREARERAEQQARAAQADAVRRDRNLVARYPDEERHRAAREAALDTVRLAIRATETRMKELSAERKPLKDEAEFYAGRTLPPKLRAALDANDAAVDAQRAAAANQQAELGRINRLYDAELERLRRLWSGAPPGTLGPIAPQPVALPTAGAPSAGR